MKEKSSYYGEDDYKNDFLSIRLWLQREYPRILKEYDKEKEQNEIIFT